MTILIPILIIAVLAYVAFFIIGQMGLPQPIDLVVKVIVGLILLAALFGGRGYFLAV